MIIPILLAAAAAPAAEPLRLETRMLVERRVAAADGTTAITLVPPARVAPGDAVVVELRWRNAGRQPIAALTVANPVPRGLLYRGPRTGSAPEVSVDGRTYGPLASLRVAVPGGTRAATAGDVTHVRWRVAQPVAPGAGGSVAFAAAVK